MDDLISEYKEIYNKKRQNKYDVTRLKEINDYLNDLFKLYPNIIIKKNDSILYNEDDSIKIKDFLFAQNGNCSLYFHIDTASGPFIVKANSQLTVSSSKEVLSQIEDLPLVKDVWYE